MDHLLKNEKAVFYGTTKMLNPNMVLCSSMIYTISFKKFSRELRRISIMEMAT